MVRKKRKNTFKQKLRTMLGWKQRKTSERTNCERNAKRRSKSERRKKKNSKGRKKLNRYSETHFRKNQASTTAPQAPLKLKPVYDETIQLYHLFFKQMFRKWKEEKDIEIREREEKKKRKEDKELRKKQEKESDKRQDSAHAFRGWFVIISSFVFTFIFARLALSTDLNHKGNFSIGFRRKRTGIKLANNALHLVAKPFT